MPSFGAYILVFPLYCENQTPELFKDIRGLPLRCSSTINICKCVCKFFLDNFKSDCALRTVFIEEWCSQKCLACLAGLWELCQCV